MRDVQPDPRPEVELARQLLEGHPEAFDRFVETFRSRVFQYSFLMCGQREDAEEVAQETMLKAFEKIEQLREPERVKSWVFQIAKNACLMMRRKSIFAPREEVSLDEPAVGDLSDSSARADGNLLQHELHDRLYEAIRALPQIYRAVLLLRDVEELSTEDTAKILDVSTDVVKTRLRRARLMMRENLGEASRQLKSFAMPGQARPLPAKVRADLFASYRRRLRSS